MADSERRGGENWLVRRMRLASEEFSKWPPGTQWLYRMDSKAEGRNTFKTEEPTMSDDLIAMLDAAPKGSRELDSYIALAIVRESYPDAHFVDEEKDVIQITPGMTTGASSELPRYTESLDTALSLMPEGFAVTDLMVWPGQPGQAVVVGKDGRWTGGAATPALALCIAALKARRNTGGDDE